MTLAPPVAEKKISEEQVQAFLKQHPEFLRRHPELLAEASATGRDLGGGIEDFQHHLLKHLQKNTKTLKTKYDGLVDFCRDNLSVQSQVHEAVLRLVRSRNLEQLLEVLTTDLISMFDVDVVRLAIESEAPEFYDTYYTEDNYSGIVFVDMGTIDHALGISKDVLLVDDAQKQPFHGLEQIFSDCSGLIRSCVLLRLDLEELSKHVVLAFGVRHPDRFHPGQGIELLHFLAQVVACQLDAYLDDMSL